MFSEEKLNQVKTITNLHLPQIENRNDSRWYKKLGWMITIWLASVLSLGIVATLFKLLMYSAGMRTH
ncbi:MULTISPECIES: DUF2474 domain-containing protein [unclassified Xenorhabdus]|uniref:DUF2474 domain-containing protein n=1 Tax=Xenorhabdus TaxID=626 RepID=UPI000C0395D2|nr:DUF2474 domain-containing protein [Xenorhabdus sp. PB30.3]PHM56826.1 hypothetical protein Xekk_01737 [Xenorhabdus sp. KK7.4]